MTDASKRLRSLRIRRGFESPIDAARAFGWNEHTYKSHENGLRGIRTEAAKRYALAFGSTVGFLLTGVDEPTDKHDVNQVIGVPLLGTAAAGVFRESIYLEDTQVIIPAVPRPDIMPDAQYCLLVDGPSVNKRIADGSYAICARYDMYPGGPRHGQLVHVERQVGGLVENTIKVVQYTPEGPMLAPASDDPRFQTPIPLDERGEDSHVRIVGVVIGEYRPL